LSAGFHVVPDPLAHLQLGEPSALQLESESQTLGDVQGLDERDLLLEGQIGRVASRVGERAGLGDGAQKGGEPPIVAADLEDLLDHRPVLALELVGLRRGRRYVGMLLDVRVQAAVGAGLRRANDTTVEGRKRCRLAPARHPHPLDDVGHDADLGVLVAVPRQQQHAAVVTEL
jgi:hypothetical protein